MVKRNRNEILETAALMFADRGFDKMDVQNLADRLKIGKGTVYRHFLSKEELFLETANHVIRTILPASTQAMDAVDDPIEKIKASYKTILSFFDQHPEYAELLIQDRANFKNRTNHTFFQFRQDAIAKYKQFFEDLITKKILRNFESEKIIQVFLAFIYGSIYVRYFSIEPRQLSQLSEDTLDIVFHGLINRVP